MNGIKPEMHFFRHQLMRIIRSFFEKREYLEVTTPIMVRCPGIDPYIDAIPAGNSFYLATSPELHMKRLLGCGLKKIYQITHAFRADEAGKHHNCEFSILEWYETGINYQCLMELTESFIQAIALEMQTPEMQAINTEMFDYAGDAVNAGNTSNAVRLTASRPSFSNTPFPRISVDAAFQEHAHWCPSQEWNEDRFFWDLIEIVEPALKSIPAFFLYDFPAPLASLSRLKPHNLCERFELYLMGVEIANGFSELTCGQEQRERFERDRAKRATMKKEPYPLDQNFLSVLENGLLPDCAGIALGIDRLLMVLSGAANISEVIAFPMARL